MPGLGSPAWPLLLGRRCPRVLVPLPLGRGGSLSIGLPTTTTTTPTRLPALPSWCGVIRGRPLSTAPSRTSVDPQWWRTTPFAAVADTNMSTTGNSRSSQSSHNDDDDDDDSPPNASTTTVSDVEDLHQQALLQKSTTYTDPQTGFVVFTERAHLLRGTCCGNQCRHCPYGWEHVTRVVDERQRPTAIVASGDAAAVQARLAAQSAAARAYRQAAPRPQGDGGTTPAATAASSPPKTGGRHGGRLTDKNVPYTRTGDQGLSSLLTGERRSKADDAFEAMGTVDELCSFVGVVQAQLWHQAQTLDHSGNEKDPSPVTLLTEHLLEIMSRLFDIGSHVAKPRRKASTDSDDSNSWSSSSASAEGKEQPRFVADGVGGGLDAAHVQVLEDWIDLLTHELPELTSFLLPTGSLLAAHFHTARTVCRRAERRMVPLVQAGVCDPNALKYVNRLSDYLFTAARYANLVLVPPTHPGRGEILYRKPHKGATQRERAV